MGRVLLAASHPRPAISPRPTRSFQADIRLAWNLSTPPGVLSLKRWGPVLLGILLPLRRIDLRIKPEHLQVGEDQHHPPQAEEQSHRDPRTGTQPINPPPPHEDADVGELR